MSGVQIIELDDSNICKLCSNALGKYSCPRCNILYCSLACYQSEQHLQCSEDFYRECVMNDLGANDETSRQRMEEILMRTQHTEEAPETLDSDDEEYKDLGERLRGVNLDDPDQVWEKLNEDEMQEFAAFLKSEDVTKLIPKWEPWWKSSTSKVQDVDTQTFANCPKVRKNIKNFSEIAKKEPSDCVQYNLINILAAYVFTTRYFNGDHFEFLQEAASTLVNVSLALKSAQNFPDFDTALKSVEQECINTEWIIIDAENVSLMKEDVDKVLKGPDKANRKHYVLAALSELLDFFEEVVRVQEMGPRTEETGKKGPFAQAFPDQHFPSVQTPVKIQMKLCAKKIEYYLSYAKEKFVWIKYE